MIELLKHAWHIKFQSTQEKGTRYTRWDVQAINPANKAFYSTDGDSIVEAVDKWFAKTATQKMEPLDLNSLYEAKLDLINQDGDK